LERSLDLVIILSARDTDASYYKVAVNFDGRSWSADRIDEHLDLTITGIQR
jgi:hypothetical protein